MAKTIVSLGSSFAAGPGLEPYVDEAAARSRRNYAHQLADLMGANLFDLTVSGATTSNILDTSQQTLNGAIFPPQINGVPATADVITITAGGNDLGFIGGMILLALQKASPDSPMLPMMQQALAPTSMGVSTTGADAHRVSRELARVVREAREAAPAARVILVDYLTVLQAGTAAECFFSPAVLQDLLDMQSTLQQVFVDAAQISGADLLQVSALSEDHTLGAADPWVQTFSTELAMIGGAFHPNEAGMTAVAIALDRHLST